MSGLCVQKGQGFTASLRQTDQTDLESNTPTEAGSQPGTAWGQGSEPEIPQQDKPRLQHDYRYQKPGRWETSSCLPILRIHVPFPGRSKAGITASWLAPYGVRRERRGSQWLASGKLGTYWVAAILQKRSCRCCGLGNTKGIGQHSLVLRALAVWARGHRKGGTSPSTVL